MVTNEEFLKALDTLLEYYKQTKTNNVEKSMEEMAKKSIQDFLDTNKKHISVRLFNILKNLQNSKKTIHIDLITWTQFRKLRNAGKVTWKEFQELRGF